MYEQRLISFLLLSARRVFCSICILASLVKHLNLSDVVLIIEKRTRYKYCWNSLWYRIHKPNEHNVLLAKASGHIQLTNRQNDMIDAVGCIHYTANTNTQCTPHFVFISICVSDLSAQMRCSCAFVLMCACVAILRSSKLCLCTSTYFVHAYYIHTYVIVVVVLRIVSIVMSEIRNGTYSLCTVACE